MSAFIGKIKTSRGGAGAYASYVLAPVRQVDKSASATESAAVAADELAYVGYALQAEKETAWYGRQAERWGLVGHDVDVTTLTQVMSHYDPTTGVDLDSSRVKRRADEAVNRAKWERWANNPQLRLRAAAFEACLDALAELPQGAGWGPASAIWKKHLEPVLPAGQYRRFEAGMGRELADGSDPRKVAGAWQGRLRLRPPRRPARVSEEPTREVIAYDVTFQAPKSVSLLLAAQMVAGVKPTVLDCHHRAVKRSVAMLEAELSSARGGRGGRDRLDIEGLCAALVTHFTARPAGDPPLSDPQLHVHGLVSALVENEKGTWSALDARVWMECVGMLAAFYDSALRAELTCELGVAWRPRVTKDMISGQLRAHWEVAFGDGDGADEMGDRLVDAFSRRTKEMEQDVADARARGKRVSSTAAWSVTRSDKDELPLEDCLSGWAERLAELGCTPEQLLSLGSENVSRFQRAEATASLRDRDQVRAQLDSRLEGRSELGRERMAVAVAGETVIEAAKLLAATGAVFSRQALIREAAKEWPAHLSAEPLIAQVDLYLTEVAPQVVVASDSVKTSWTQALWTSPEHLELEMAVIDTVRQLMAPTAPAVSAEVAKAVIEMYALAEGGAKGRLTDEQLRFFMAAVRTDSRLCAVVAPAGSGKSYAAAAIAEALRKESARNRVFCVSLASRAGVALSGDLLRNRADFEGSIDRILFHLDHGLLKLGAHDTVIVDESAMASTAKLGSLLALIEAAGARVVLIGDQEQLDSPAAAGGLLRLLDRRQMTVRFDTTTRNRDKATRDTQIAWRTALEKGDRDAAAATVHHYVRSGEVSLADSPTDAVELAFESWRREYEAAEKRGQEWDAGIRDEVWNARLDELEAKQEAAFVRLAEAKEFVAVIENGVPPAPGPEKVWWEDELLCAQEELQQAKAELKTSSAALERHRNDREAGIRGQLALLADTHQDVAVLSDRAYAFLIDRGALHNTVTVTGRRFRNVDGEQVPLEAEDGSDLSEVEYCKGMQVRFTKNAKSGHIEAQMERAIEKGMAKAKRDLPGKDYTDEQLRKLAFARDRDLYKLSQVLKDSRALNGQVCTVETVHPDDESMTVRMPDGRTVRLSQDQLNDGIVVPACGGAMTVYASQGATFDYTAACLRNGVSGNILYVTQTRSRGRSDIVFNVDSERVNPRVQEWENNKRLARLNGEEFTQPEPVEALPGLWQLEQQWSTSGTATMAVQLAESDDRTVVTAADRKLAAELLRRQGVTKPTVAQVEERAVAVAEQRNTLDRVRAQQVKGQVAEQVATMQM